MHILKCNYHNFIKFFLVFGFVLTHITVWHDTHLMLIKYWANATESGLPLIVIVRSVLPPSRSSQFEMRIIAPEIWRISAIFVPPLPIMQPIKSLDTVISCCCCCVRLVLAVRSCEPAKAAKAALVSKWETY